MVILVMFGMSYVYRALRELDPDLVTLLISSIFVVLLLAIYIAPTNETELLYRFSIISFCFVMPYLRDGWNMLSRKLGRKYEDIMLDPYLKSLLGSNQLEEIIECIEDKFGKVVRIRKTGKIHIAVRKGEEVVDAFIVYLGQLGSENLEECYKASRVYVTPKILVANESARKDVEEVLSKVFVSKTNYVMINLKSFRDEYEKIPVK